VLGGHVENPNIGLGYHLKNSPNIQNHDIHSEILTPRSKKYEIWLVYIQNKFLKIKFRNLSKISNSCPNLDITTHNKFKS
jgi:hypothetical protein